jgi:hypothetical protein
VQEWQSRCSEQTEWRARVPCGVEGDVGLVILRIAKVARENNDRDENKAIMN